MMVIKGKKYRLKIFNFIIFIVLLIFIFYILGRLIFMLPLFNKTYNYFLKKGNYEIDEITTFKSSFLKCEIKKFNTIKKAIKNNSLKKAFVSKELICYIHNEIEKENKRLINDLAIMFPNAFLCALYIKTIER